MSERRDIVSAGMYILTVWVLVICVAAAVGLAVEVLR